MGAYGNFSSGRTICAISTAPGSGGIAVIRVSGAEAVLVVDRVFKMKNPGLKLSDVSGYTVHFGTIVDKKSELIDEVLVTVFRNPHSFTGEDVVEIACHGSIYIQEQILHLLLQHGCALAKPGEFSMSAFSNGKLDLSQAEAVADLIASTTASSHRMALNQMRGGFSKELSLLRDKLLHFVSLVELELDFSEEDIAFADRDELRDNILQLLEKMTRLLDSFDAGRMMRDGIRTALLGRPNVGKSSVLNRLLQHDRAIVSEIPGTTRDTLEESIEIDGLHFRIIDTAGIRESKNTIEKLGVDRAWQEMENADLCLMIFDGSQKLKREDKKLLHLAKTHSRRVLVLVNKSDLQQNRENQEYFAQQNLDLLHLSAKQGQGVAELKQAMRDWAPSLAERKESVVISKLRHKQALLACQQALNRALQSIQNQLSPEFISVDLRQSLDALAELTGTITTDDILNTIFDQFCIGK